MISHGPVMTGTRDIADALYTGTRDFVDALYNGKFFAYGCELDGSGRRDEIMFSVSLHIQYAVHSIYAYSITNDTLHTKQCIKGYVVYKAHNKRTLCVIRTLRIKRTNRKDALHTNY